MGPSHVPHAKDAPDPKTHIDNIVAAIAVFPNIFPPFIVNELLLTYDPAATIKIICLVRRDVNDVEWV
jgi:hypothetical protein